MKSVCCLLLVFLPAWLSGSLGIIKLTEEGKWGHAHRHAHIFTDPWSKTFKTGRGKGSLYQLAGSRVPPTHALAGCSATAELEIATGETHGGVITVLMWPRLGVIFSHYGNLIIKSREAIPICDSLPEKSTDLMKLSRVCPGKLRRRNTVPPAILTGKIN